MYDVYSHISTFLLFMLWKSALWYKIKQYKSFIFKIYEHCQHYRWNELRHQCLLFISSDTAYMRRIRVYTVYVHARNWFRNIVNGNTQIGGYDSWCLNYEDWKRCNQMLWISRRISYTRNWTRWCLSWMQIVSASTNSILLACTLTI